MIKLIEAVYILTKCASLNIITRDEQFYVDFVKVFCYLHLVHKASHCVGGFSRNSWVMDRSGAHAQRLVGNGLQAVSHELGLAPVVPEPLEVVCLHNCLFSQHLLSPCRSVVLKKESKNLLLRWWADSLNGNHSSLSFHKCK